MTKIFLEVNGTHAVASADGKLTSGMVGLPVTIDYDDSWDGLTKTAFFRVGNSVRKRDSVGTYTEVPWEILRTHGNVLEIGIEGKNENGSVVIPTTWAVVSKIQQGAQGDIPAAPKPGVSQPSGGAGANIDDSQISSSTTWSSEKIDKEIKNGKSEIIKDNLISYNSCWSSKNTVDKLCPAFAESGAAVQCQPVEGYPLEVISNINPKESGDPWGEIKLYHTGKNLCNYRPSYQKTSNSVVVEQLENGVIVQGNAGATPGANLNSCGWFYPIGNTDRGDNLLYLKAGQRICISADYTILDEPYGAHDGHINIMLHDPNFKFESATFGVYIAPEVGKKYKISACANIKTTGYYCFFISLNSCKVKIENIQVEIGDTATAFEPYKGTTVYTVDFSNYGLLSEGSYNWTTGVLTDEAGNLYQHNPETNTFKMIDEESTAVVRGIHAFPGVNTLISDCGDTTAKGKADPVSVIEKLTNAIIALGGNV